MRCHNCGNDLECVKEKWHYTESGLDNIFLEGVDVFRCSVCGEEIVSIPSMPKLNTVIGCILILKQSPLNGKEIRYLRKNMGYSAKKFAAALAIDKSTLSRWEHGVRPPSSSLDRAIRLLYSVTKGLDQEQNKRLVDDTFASIDSEVKNDLELIIPHSKWSKDGSMCHR